jgi:hypothetical protein
MGECHDQAEARPDRRRQTHQGHAGTACLHRDLTAYAEILGREAGQSPTDPVRLIVPMLERFIATDRGFAKVQRARQAQS